MLLMAARVEMTEDDEVTGHQCSCHSGISCWFQLKALFKVASIKAKTVGLNSGKFKLGLNNRSPECSKAYILMVN